MDHEPGDHGIFKSGTSQLVQDLQQLARMPGRDGSKRSVMLAAADRLLEQQLDIECLQRMVRDPEK